MFKPLVIIHYILIKWIDSSRVILFNQKFLQSSFIILYNDDDKHDRDEKLSYGMFDGRKKSHAFYFKLGPLQGIQVGIIKVIGA